MTSFLLKNVMTGDLNQMITMNITNGVGSTEVMINNPGIYDIADDFIRSKPTTEIVKTVDIIVV